MLSISINLLALTHTFAYESHIFTSFHFCHSSLSSHNQVREQEQAGGDGSIETDNHGGTQTIPAKHFTQMSFEFSLPLVKQEGVYTMPCGLAQLAGLVTPSLPCPAQLFVIASLQLLHLSFHT